MIFKPTLPFNFFNTFCGLRAKKIIICSDIWNSPIAPILQHLLCVWANNNEQHYLYIIKWLAYRVQYPWLKPEVALLFINEPGAGMNIITNWLIDHIFSVKYGTTVDKIDHVTGRFNTLVENKLLCVLNEINANNNKWSYVMDIIKSLITEPKQSFEHKSTDPYDLYSYVAFIIFSNRLIPFKIDDDCRRFLLVIAIVSTVKILIILRN